MENALGTYLFMLEDLGFDRALECIATHTTGAVVRVATENGAIDNLSTGGTSRMHSERCKRSTHQLDIVPVAGEHVHEHRWVGTNPLNACDWL